MAEKDEHMAQSMDVKPKEKTYKTKISANFKSHVALMEKNLAALAGEKPELRKFNSSSVKKKIAPKPVHFDSSTLDEEPEAFAMLD